MNFNQTKIYLLLIIFSMFLMNIGNTALAANKKIVNIAVVLDEIHMIQGSPESMTPVLDSKYLIPIVQNTMDKIFNDTNKYSLQPLEKTVGYALTYRQENKLMQYTDFSEESTQTLIGSLQNKAGALENICKHFDADYLIYAKIDTVEAPLSDEKAVNLVSGSWVHLYIFSNKHNQLIDTPMFFGGRVLKKFRRSDLNEKNIAILKNETHDTEKEVWTIILK